MTEAAFSSGDFSIGQVFADVVKVIRREFPTLLVVSAIFGALPTAASSYFVGRVGAGDGFGAFWLGRLVLIVPTAIAQGALVHSTFLNLTGERASLGGALATGLRHFLPLAVIGAIYGVALCFGLLFLIIPGVIIMASWAVIQPVQVVENTGVFLPFDRSAKLTEGHRLSVLAIEIMLFLIGLALNLVFTRLGDPFDGLALGRTDLVALLMMALATMISTMIRGVTISALYFELRRSREGVSITSLASVFD